MEIRNNIPDVGGLTEVRYIVAHETANPSSTMDNEIAYMERNWRNAFVSHFVGDSGRVVQVHSPGRLQWGAGGKANKYAYAQVELCEDKLNADAFKKNYVAYVNLLRSLAQQAGLPLKLDEGRGIVTHAWISNNLGGTDHNDPYPFLARMGISKAQFKHDVENGVGNVPNNPPKPSLKPINVIAQEVINGAWGSGEDRKNRLTAAGYDYNAVQAEVNRILGASKPQLKPVATIAQEVIDGKWGSGDDRKNRLINAGYNYNTVQAEVNRLLGVSKPSQPAPKWISQNGKFKLNTAIKLRSGASTGSGVIATLPAGSVVNYDAFIHLNGYVWIRQPRGNSYGYLATGNSVNGKRQNYWGTFY